MAQNTPPTHFQAEERDQAGQLVAQYITSSDRVDVIVPENSKAYTRKLLSAFLPAGYPQSVTEDYLEYQIYDSLQAFSSSIAGLLASRAVLEGVGVGDANASPTTALLLSILQESMGRIATIMFAHKLGTSLEPECKMYRLAADVFNDAALILDCLSPVFPKASRVMLLSFSSILRALCGVAAGSSKASLSAHFATQGNLGHMEIVKLGDAVGKMLAIVSNKPQKDSSQETIISLLGMLAGSFVVSRITSRLASWLTLLFLLSIHLATNYLAVRAVSMRTLNRQRANIVFSYFLTSSNREKPSSFQKPQERIERNQLYQCRLPTPKEVSLRERIFELGGVIRWHDGLIMGYCTLGVPLKAILDTLPLLARNPSTGSYSPVNCGEVRNKATSTKRDTDVTIQTLVELFSTEEYILSYSLDHSPSLNPRGPRFYIALTDVSNTLTQLKGWFHALLCARKLKADLENPPQSMINLLKETLEEVRSCWAELIGELEEVGWDVETAALEVKSGVRARFGYDAKGG